MRRMTMNNHFSEVVIARQKLIADPKQIIFVLLIERNILAARRRGRRNNR